MGTDLFWFPAPIPLGDRLGLGEGWGNISTPWGTPLGADDTFSLFFLIFSFLMGGSRLRMRGDVGSKSFFHICEGRQRGGREGPRRGGHGRGRGGLGRGGLGEGRRESKLTS